MSGLRGVKYAKKNTGSKTLFKGNNIHENDVAKINKTLDTIEIIKNNPHVLNDIKTLPDGTQYIITPYEKKAGKTKNKKSKTKKNKKSKKQRKTRKH